MNSRWHLLRISLLLATLLLVPGCPRPWVLLAHNNTGSDLVAQTKNGMIPWKSGTTLSIGSDGRIEWEDLEHVDGQAPWGQERRAPMLIVRTPVGVKRYWLAMVGFPVQYDEERKGVATRRLQLQLDWKLYALLARSRFPVKTLPEQPEYMPLKPR